MSAEDIPRVLRIVYVELRYQCYNDSFVTHRYYGPMKSNARLWVSIFLFNYNSL